MTANRSGWLQQLPTVTKNILILNLGIWVFDVFSKRFGADLTGWLGLVSWSASAFGGTYSFHIWQLVTYMFMHANFMHIFCNMFAVLMFGPILEQQWGSKKFLTYYMVSGIGAALVQQVVWMLTMPGQMAVAIGASGAVFGLLFAFGWLFPEQKIFFLFIPIPIPARVFVGIYAAIELIAGIEGSVGDNVAHFAHLGGMLFGWLLLLYWLKAPKLREKAKEKADTPFMHYHYQSPVEEDKPAEPTKRSDDVERLLDKIKHEGYSSLTQEEKDRLFKH